ncbi:MAG: response regulator [Patescibacteria group bacterium]
MAKKILLVEDDPFIIDIYITKLKESGFEVISATNGLEALIKAKKEKPNLILLDIVLPQLTGFEVLQEIRGIKELSKVPVIILSNLGQKNEIERGMKLGATQYLIKAHFKPSEVIEEIKEILKIN